MKFDMIFPQDHVKYNPLVAKRMSEFPDAALWDGESVTCLMEVKRATSDIIELFCAEGCGGHSIASCTREEYNEYSAILGESLLLESSVNEFLAKQEEEEYALDEEVEHLISIISGQVKNRKA